MTAIDEFINFLLDEVVIPELEKESKKLESNSDIEEVVSDTK